MLNGNLITLFEKNLRSMRCGACKLINAKLFAAAASTKTMDGKCDSEMSPSWKGN